MDDKRRIIEGLVADLARQGKAHEALKLLLESGDLENALPIAQKARAEMDSVLRRLREATGRPQEDVAPSSAVPVESESPRHERPEPSTWTALENRLETIDLGKLRTFFLGSPWRVAAVAAVAALVLGLWGHRAWIHGRHGLSAEYFSDRELSQPQLKRKDPVISFRWMRRPPKGLPSPDDFSVRWSGYLETPAAGEYEFQTLADDGVRLWINDQLLIDDWNIHGATLRTGRVTLGTGRQRIRIEYFQGSGDTVLKLFWRLPGETKRRLIGARYLLPDGTPA